MNKKVVIKKFGAPEVIEIVAEPIPEPASGEARIKVEASTVNTTDTLIRKGIYPLLKDKPPFTLGYDLVGRIDRLGAGANDFNIGERVAALIQIGGNCEYVCLPTQSLLPVDDAADAADAVFLVLSGMTAYQMLKHFAAVKSGQRILIQGGSGAVGTALIQLGGHFGLDMTATASREKLDFVRRLGARAVDYKSPDYERELKEIAGDGFDAAFDAVGNRSFNLSFKMLNESGKLVTYGTLAKAKAIERKTFFNFLAFGAEFGAMMLKNKLRSSFSGGKSAEFFGIVDSRQLYPDRFQTDLTELFGLLENGAIKPVVQQRLKIEDAQKAHRLLDGGKVTGQLVLVMN